MSASQPIPADIREGARLIQHGEIVAYPTEAVFGLGCDPRNRDAVYALLALKQRPVEKGLILIAASLEQLQPFVTLEDEWLESVTATWPGPHTWLLPAAPDLPAWINGGQASVACRVTAHPTAKDLCAATGYPLISTSANRAGQPPARSADEVRQFCPGVEHIVHGKLGGLAQPTPIRDARSGQRLR